MGVFVQTNADTHMGRSHPIGYVVQENGCWEWVGGHNDQGYGSMYDKHTGTRGAHRVMYGRVRGPVPVGMVLDHLCRNRGCVNPAHMEVTTNKQNILRGVSPSANHARKTRCPKGHALTDDNLDRNMLTYGKRTCRTCHNERCRARRARLRNDPAWLERERKRDRENKVHARRVAR